MTGRRGYFESEDAYVRRASDEAVSAASSAARQADARLSEQIQSTEGRLNALTARIDGLSQAFDTFLEAAELRRECERYWAAAGVRAFVQTHIGALMGPGEPVPSPTGVADVPGYWLPPAVLGLVRLLDGSGDQAGGGGDQAGGGDKDAEAAEAAEQLAEASRRDALRTAIFLVSILGARGAGEEAEPWLGAALPAADDPEVTLAARCLWLAYSAGVHGDAGRAVLSEWLGGRAASVSSEDLEKALVAFGGQPQTLALPAENPRTRNLRSQPIENSLRDAATAAGSLATLRDALNGTSRPTDAAAASTPQAPTVLDPTPETLLTALIEEGSPPEAELRRKAAALEARARRSAQREGSPRPTTWDASTGPAAGLLLADLFDTAEAAAVHRTTALTALARPLAALADKLLARTAELPSTLPVSIPWQPRPITLDHATSFDERLAAVHADIERTIAAESPGSSRRQAEVNRRVAEEQKERATERLRNAADVLAAYRHQGEEIYLAAKAAYADVMSQLGSHAEGSAV
jgi:hypothetical protein